MFYITSEPDNVPNQPIRRFTQPENQTIVPNQINQSDVLHNQPIKWLYKINEMQAYV
jgi:hypothetical protein